MIGLTYNYYSNLLSIHNPTRTIEFSYNIKQVVETESMLIVLIAAPMEFHRNVYGINVKDEIAWQIEQPQCNGTFVNLYLDKGELVAGNWKAFEYYLDARTGIVTKIVVS